MDFPTIQKLVESGMGAASFVLLVAGGIYVAKFGNTLLNNHMKHMQATLDRILDVLERKL